MLPSTVASVISFLFVILFFSFRSVSHFKRYSWLIFILYGGHVVDIGLGWQLGGCGEFPGRPIARPSADHDCGLFLAHVAGLVRTRAARPTADLDCCLFLAHVAGLVRTRAARPTADLDCGLFQARIAGLFTTRTADRVHTADHDLPDCRSPRHATACGASPIDGISLSFLAPDLACLFMAPPSVACLPTAYGTSVPCAGGKLGLPLSSLFSFSAPPSAACLPTAHSTTGLCAGGKLGLPFSSLFSF